MELTLVEQIEVTFRAVRKIRPNAQFSISDNDPIMVVCIFFFAPFNKES